LSSYEKRAQVSEQPKDLTEFLGRIGNLYGNKGLCSPFHLKEHAERWLSDGISPSHCIEQIRQYLEQHARNIRSGSGDDTLGPLDTVIRRTWFESQYPRANSATANRRSESESQVIPEVDESSNDQVKPWWAPPAPLRREPVQSARDYACAFVLRELADGELPARELERRAKAARIADRTLDRARKKLEVVSRRTGFGRNSQHWVSLPKPRNED
jgi:hypothetical protein